jgi:hypothetical protein
MLQNHLAASDDLVQSPLTDIAAETKIETKDDEVSSSVSKRPNSDKRDESSMTPIDTNSEIINNNKNEIKKKI